MSGAGLQPHSPVGQAGGPPWLPVYLFPLIACEK